MSLHKVPAFNEISMSSHEPIVDVRSCISAVVIDVESFALGRLQFLGSVALLAIKEIQRH